MYTVNVALLSGYEVKVAKGTPSILALNPKQVGVAAPSFPTVTFQSSENFELHIMHNGECHGVLTPGGGR